MKKEDAAKMQLLFKAYDNAYRYTLQKLSRYSYIKKEDTEEEQSVKEKRFEKEKFEYDKRIKKEMDIINQFEKIEINDKEGDKIRKIVLNYAKCLSSFYNRSIQSYEAFSTMQEEKRKLDNFDTMLHDMNTHPVKKTFLHMTKYKKYQEKLEELKEKRTEQNKLYLEKKKQMDEIYSDVTNITKKYDVLMDRIVVLQNKWKTTDAGNK